MREIQQLNERLSSEMQRIGYGYMEPGVYDALLRRGQSEREALQRRHHTEWEAHKEKLREASKRQEEERLAAQRQREEERKAREAAVAKQRALEREARERQRREEIAQQQEQARQAAIIQQQEQRARQAEWQRLQAEAADRFAQERAISLREAYGVLHQLGGGMVAMVVVLTVIPAYRLYAPQRLMAFSHWDYKGLLVLSSVAFSIFFWLVSVDPAESPGTVYVAALFGVIGLPAVFFLPGALLLLVQFVHYLFVPHPAESYIDQARRSRDLNLDAALGAAESMYDPRRDGVFDVWRANNRKRRLDAEAEMLRKENEAMEELIRNQKVKARRPLE